MKNKTIRLTTISAFTAIILLQCLWLYNTYILLEAEFEKQIKDLFIISVEKEAMNRLLDHERKGMWKNKEVRGLQPDNDHYANNLALQEYLFLEDYPLSIEKLDSVFAEAIKGSYKNIVFSFSITDSSEHQKTSVNFNPKNLARHLTYRETIQLRMINPEYITLTISAPYKVIFGKMLLTLIGTLILAVVGLYGLFYQINIIRRQDIVAKLRQDFSNAMVHDMMTPISSILLGINALKNEKIDCNPIKKKKYQNAIEKEGEHIQRLVGKVIEIAKFEGQHVKLSKQQVNLKDLLNSLIERYTSCTTKTVRHSIELNNIETIYADLHYIKETFGNLIDNAIKYSKVNEDVEISITCLHKGNYAQMIFRDNGIGISEKDQKRIFKKYERGSSVTKYHRETIGFGLGLHFVSQIMKAHDGTIEVKSSLGSYSEFIIKLPYNENNKSVID